MKRIGLLFAAALALAGCGGGNGLSGLFGGRQSPQPQVVVVPEKSAEAPAEAAQTPDANSAEGSAPAGRETDLGLTVASLGAAGEPGLWLKTPLVDRPGRGRVEYPEKGTAVAVDLIPLAAAPGAGSRLSLAAMRTLQADLTALPELRVFRTE